MVQNIHGGIKCPKCSEESSLRISRPRNSKERILTFISFAKIYRCKKCGWREWKINLSADAKNIKKIFIYILLMLIAAFVVYRILKLVV